MKINDPNFNQNISNSPTDQTQSTGQVGRWQGAPGLPEPSRLQPAPQGPGDDPIARLSARQPEFTPPENLHEMESTNLEPLENWLSKSPENINQYVENHIMDALLESHFKRL